MRKFGVLAALAFALLAAPFTLERATWARSQLTWRVQSWRTAAAQPVPLMSRSRPPHNRCLLRRRLLTAVTLIVRGKVRSSSCIVTPPGKIFAAHPLLLILLYVLRAPLPAAVDHR